MAASRAGRLRGLGGSGARYAEVPPGDGRVRPSQTCVVPAGTCSAPGYHRGVSERPADPQVVCPFVALEYDRDFRSPVPDHGHRCYAESPAAPRALAHQAAYCLAPAFPGCPTFQDWAKREAAPPRPDALGRSPRGAPPRGTAPAGPAPAAAGPVPAREPRPSDAGWSAPPPWARASAHGDEEPRAAAALDADRDAAPSRPAADAAPPPPAADAAPSRRAAEVPPEPPSALVAEEPARFALDEGAAPAFLASRGRPRPSRDEFPEDEEPWPGEQEATTPPRRPAVDARRAPVGYAPVGASRGERRVAGTHREIVDPEAPSWEQPRRFESYPSLRSRGGGIPRPVAYALIVLLVGVALFATPFLLRGFGGGGDGAAPTPSPAGSAVASAAPSPTPVPTPAQIVYVVKAGDTVSKIASRYGVTIDQLLAANPQIKNANQIAIGDQVVIPQPQPTEIVDSGASPAPSP